MKNSIVMHDEIMLVVPSEYKPQTADDRAYG